MNKEHYDILKIKINYTLIELQQKIFFFKFNNNI